MSDLTDFLLARIAEDEAVARSVQASIDALPEEPLAPGELPPPGAWMIYYTMPRPPLAMVSIQPGRVLAECESKRRIVEDRPRIVGQGVSSVGDLRAIHDEVQRQREYVLRALALPYADHPDYDDPDWS